MNANELRIGNCVGFEYRRDFYIGTVEAINKKTVTIKSNSISYSVKYANVLKIQITERWLLYFGFVKVKFGWYDNGIFSLHITEKRCTTVASESSYNSLPYPEFLHTLQNIYFAFMGEDLVWQQ